MVVLVLVGVVLAVLGAGTWFWFALTGVPWWRPPQVAPLAPGATFSADLVQTHGDGYIAAGVVGTREPDEDGRCSGRFTLVEIESDGSARAAVVASGLESDRWCANEVEALVRDGEGGWLIAGAGRSESEPSLEDQGRRGERLTLRISADGDPREDFGDDGILHKTVVVGRVQGELITDQLERVTPEGEVRDDVLLDADTTYSTWTDLFALDDEIVVAVEPFGDLHLQTFVVEGISPKLRYRPLRPPLLGGADPYSRAFSVDVGESRNTFSSARVDLYQGRLYVLRQPYQSHGNADEPRLIAVDPRRWELDRSFGEDGIVALRGLGDAPAAFAVERDGEVVISGASNREPLPGGMRVLRLSASGSADADFGGTVPTAGVPGAAQVLIDGEGRAVVLESSGSSLVRLTLEGQLDPSFGNDGVAGLGDLDVCSLAPGAFAEACTER
ncbi:MAG: hypothetical protein H0U00_07340 [Actinobacteria bacterium]|nr:hypothetical protein [Actinomycetota bacterium]